MKILYGGRLARLDLLQVVQLLAPRITKWTLTCDIALHRLMCYINSTVDMVLSCYIGDSRDVLGLDLYADADWAGNRVDYKSTSGAIILLSGANSR